jgi:protein involved in polysaccharide export with SLBB domain
MSDWWPFCYAGLALDGPYFHAVLSATVSLALSGSAVESKNKKFASSLLGNQGDVHLKLAAKRGTYAPAQIDRIQAWSGSDGLARRCRSRLVSVSSARSIGSAFKDVLFSADFREECIASSSESGWRFMYSGGGRSIWWAGLPTPLLILLSGCLSNREQIEQALIAYRPPPAHLVQVASKYRARCPDLLQVNIAGLPQYSGAQHIGPDGCIDLGDAGRPHVDGETVPEIVRTVAESVGVAPEQVGISIAEYNSQYLYLFGQIAGNQRAVPYRGPETVLDLLHRVGGLQQGAAVRDVTVIRPHIAEGKTPEIFHIDLAAIVLRNDPETNILLQPSDQIHIGQSSRSSFCDCLPPWLRSVFSRPKRGLNTEPQGSSIVDLGRNPYRR